MKITKEQIKDIAIRTAKTALIAFLVALGGALAVIFTTDLNELKVALYHAFITAAMTAGTAVLNILVKLIKNFIDDWKLTANEIEEAFGGIDNVDDN